MTQPGLSAAGLRLVVTMALVEAAGLLAGSSETTGLAVLVNGVDDPVDARVDADGLVLGVDEDDLVVLVRGVLVDPVRVEDAQVGAASADTLLGGGLEGSLVLELVHTLVGGLACLDSQHEWYRIRSGGCRESRDGHVECGEDKAFGRMASLSLGADPKFLRPQALFVRTIGGTLGNRTLAAAAANADAVNDIALLGLVSEAPGLVGARRARGAVNHVQLTVLYYALSAKVQRVYSTDRAAGYFESLSFSHSSKG